VKALGVEVDEFPVDREVVGAVTGDGDGGVDGVVGVPKR